MIWKREDDAHERGGTKTKAAADAAADLVFLFFFSYVLVQTPKQT